MILNITKQDYNEIASQIEEGRSYVEFEKDGMLLTFDYELCVEGYVEDDYYNGTGAFVETSREFYVSNIECTDEDCNDVDCNFDEYELEKFVA